MNIYERIKGRRTHLPEALVKQYTYQLLKALDHMHRNGIFHRDIKPENVLVNVSVRVRACVRELYCECVSHDSLFFLSER